MKKIYKLVLKSYLGPLFLTFFIILFILMMNFVWRYIDELVGKGLDPLVIAELLMYATINMIPMGLPLYPDITEGGLGCYECSFMDALYANGKDEILAKVRSGQALKLGLSFNTAVSNGVETKQEHRMLILKPDPGTAADGTYLRWLNRRGEVSYWLFTNSQARVITTANDGFERHYSGDPSVPVSNSYINNRKGDFREAREMVIGAIGLSPAEYDDLCSLATSPLVERLTKNAWDSPENTAYTWQRVNVAAGTYSRNIKRQTPNLQDLEFVIELPERNTIKL